MATAVERRPAATRKPTNVSLDFELVKAAKETGINVSRACEAGLAAAVKKERERRWIEENRPAMEYWNRWVEENGLPLAEYRRI